MDRNICLAEVGAFEQQRRVCGPGDSISHAIAVIQGGGVPPSAEALVGVTGNLFLLPSEVDGGRGCIREQRRDPSLEKRRMPKHPKARFAYGWPSNDQAGTGKDI
jgi:hypothetical protein